MKTLSMERILVAFVFSLSSLCLTAKADTVAGNTQQIKYIKAPLICPENRREDHVNWEML